MIDKKFIQSHTENYESVMDQINKIKVQDAALQCGITEDKIYEAAKMIGTSQSYLSMWAMGLNQSANGVDKNHALINLHLLTGTIGKEGCGPFSLTGQPNAMGGREVGGMASLLAVHKDLANPKDRKDVARFWRSSDISEKPGYTATQMFEALDSGKMKAIWIICTNPAVSMPKSNLIKRALQKAKLVIVQDISHKSDTTRYADILLPAAGWAEKEGTMTNSDRRVSYLPKIFDPPGEAQPDYMILCQFAKKMGYQGFNLGSSEEVYEEYTRMTKGTNIDVSGLSHQRLQKEGSFQWPVPHSKHPGTPRLFMDHRFYTPSGKAQFQTIKNTRLTGSDALSKDHPYVLTTGRIRDQWHTMTRTGKVNKLTKHIEHAFVEIHPADALAKSVKEGDMVIIKNERGKSLVKAVVTDKIKEGTLFMPMHFGDIYGNGITKANNLTSFNIDPVSKQPDFKFSAVDFFKFQKRKERICVIGAGAAAYRFVKTYRELNKRDDIDVFSKENYAFYNRVLLPEYISKEKSWEELEKMTPNESSNAGVKVHYGTAIKNIDRENQNITSSNGGVFYYDKLILATGSRPFLPPEVPIHLPGVFTIRYRMDADNIAKYIANLKLVEEQVHIVVVGGGLLGLEIAAALNSLNYKITIVQRGSRLMERQLDRIGSNLLANDVENKGIHTYFNNEVNTLYNVSKSQMEVRLKSGRKIDCHSVIYAIGTVPNIQIANVAELNCGRGVKVDHYLTTSDPSIHAIGEIAEFNNERYGITAAAEQQADILAQYLNGDHSAVYTGSTSLNILKFADLDLCSIGIIPIGADSDNYEEIVYTDLSRGYYKKCIIKNDRLVGAIMIGDKSLFADFRNLIENKIELSEKRTELILGRQEKEPMLGKVICSCNNVGDGNILNAIGNGCSSLDMICKQTGAGLGCGSCKPEILSVLKKTNLTEANVK